LGQVHGKFLSWSVVETLLIFRKVKGFVIPQESCLFSAIIPGLRHRVAPAAPEAGAAGARAGLN
jgi:hypothetical protein